MTKMKNLNTTWQTTIFVLIAVFGFVLFANSSVAAQDKKFKAGDRVLASPTFMDDEKYWYKCTYVKFDNSTNSPYVVKCDDREYYVQSKYIRLLNEAEMRVDSEKRNQTNADNRNQTAGQAEQIEQQAGTTSVAGECSFEAPAPKYSNTDRFSANLAKRNIYDGYERYANGTLSAPLRVGVMFLSFEVGKPYTNTVRNIPGRGAQRINDAAPPNATIYRVKSKHIVCDEYSDGVQRKQVTSDYDCFKNRDGEWVCGSGGDVPPKIIQLN
jgi:hypothetical protein